MGAKDRLKSLLIDYWTEGDKNRKEEVYKKLHPELKRLVYSTLRRRYGSSISDEDIKDVFHDWLAKKIFQEKLDKEVLRLSTEYGFKKYLIKSVQNSYLDIMKKRKRESIVDEDLKETFRERKQEPDPALRLWAKKIAENISKSMTDRQSNIFFEHICKGIPVEEICGKYGFGKSTVYNEIKNIIDMIGKEADSVEDGEAIMEELGVIVRVTICSGSEPLEK